MPGLDGIGVARALADARPLARRSLRHRVRPVRRRRLRGRGGRLSDEAGRAGPAPARARPRPRISRSSARPGRRAPARPRNGCEEFWASDLTGLVRIAARDVDRVSAERDYMRLHVGRRSWLIHHSMAALEEGLDPELFVRLHRSAIVRKDFITGFTRNPSGRWIARLGDGDRAAGRPALFRPRAEHRRPLRKTAARLEGSARGSSSGSLNTVGSDDDRRGAEDLHAGMARACDGRLECRLRVGDRRLAAIIDRSHEAEIERKTCVADSLRGDRQYGAGACSARSQSRGSSRHRTHERTNGRQPG